MTFAAPTSVAARTGKPPAIRAVCLDVDDTLVDYTGSARAALATLLAGTGCSVDAAWPTWQQVSDEHAAAVAAGRLPYEGMHALRTHAFFAAVGEEIDIAEAASRERVRADRMRRCWRLFDDALDCLDWLRAWGMKIGAVTNASGSHQWEKLSDLGLAAAFDCVVIAGEVGAVKPDPVIFHTACARLGCEPGEVAHVGDKLDADAMGACRAGLHGIWLDRDGHTDLAPPAGIPVVAGLGQLPEVLVGDLPAAGRDPHFRQSAVVGYDRSSVAGAAC